MSSLLQSLLDPKKNQSAAQHLKAFSRRFRNYGVRCEEVDSKEVLNRLPRGIVDAGNQGLKGTMDLQGTRLPFRSSLLAHAKKESGTIPFLHQARFFSSVAAESIQNSPGNSTKNILRPLSPHLPFYQPQVSSTLSITHRISIAFLTAVVLAYHLLYLKMGLICLSFQSFYDLLFYSSKLNMVTLELSALASAYTLWHGIHHLRGVGAKVLK